MANRRGRPKKILVDDKAEEDFDFALSQESEEQRTSALLEAVQKQYTADLEKKRARREKAFLDRAEKELNKETAETAKIVQDAMNELEELYSKFLLDYAAKEDKIRKLWSYIQKEEENLINLLEKRAKEDQEVVQKASVGQLSGLSKIRIACNASQMAIDRFRNPGQETLNRKNRS
ncbi:hypothetical protein JR316_0007298 [Psilocybe cubensis]|uniref:Uncharacterized protein n=2 Tax=Psilocybe cubensis TaxID=181762 RepID=A0A8H7XT62_PSICU|nr:hypothetical protein JR316_0007298 [Psilocybe cubensis]KAH9480698.1 hypothetical protein JR316_0007298 [Psilocybe cubensis]